MRDLSLFPRSALDASQANSEDGDDESHEDNGVPIPG